MLFFSRKQKVHLSPRLARTIGQAGIPAGGYFGQIAVVLGLGILLSYLFFGTGAGNKSASQAADLNNGEVLGIQMPGLLNYVVQSGDTLLGISQKYNVYWMTVVEENELQSPYTLKPGQILRIPLPRN
jgi:hypothetical protein